MRITHIVGNRPQFIKLAPIIEESKNMNEVENVIIHTGQHYDYNMSQIFLNELGLPDPDYHLEVGSATHGVQTGKMLMKLDAVLLKEKTDVALVYGDTNTTLAGALAAYKLHIPTGHVEAGLRESIWRPEEINKKIADHCSDFCFCPMERAVNVLMQEGVPKDRIFFTGDITYDAFLAHSEVASKDPQILNELNLSRNGYFLLTMHRAETVDYYGEVINVINALLILSKEHTIVFPMHPRTRRSLQRLRLFLPLEKEENIILTNPLGYFEFLNLLLNSKLVITDSGGVLKEAFYALKPSITIEDTSEYTEIFDLGYSVLTGKQEKEKVLAAVSRMLSKKLSHPRVNLFGDGKAAENILKILACKIPNA